MENRLRSGKNYKPPSIIFYDLETDGFNPYYNKIIEIGAVKYFNGKITKFNNLVSIDTLLPKKISEITKIENEDLKGQPKIEEVLKKFINFIYKDSASDIFMIAHNNDSFDKLFLKINLSKINNKRNIHNLIYIDSLRFCQKLLPSRYSHSMKNLCKDFDIIQENAHRALDDAENLFFLYKKMCAVLSMNTEYSYKYLLNKPSIIYNYIYDYE